MPEPTPPLDLDAIEARANAASPGPWEVETDALGDGVFQTRVGGHAILRADGYERQNERIRLNATFIAHAREDVPALLARVRALEAENTLLRRIIHQHGITWFEPATITADDGA